MSRDEVGAVIWGLANCDSCRKARAALAQAGLEVVLRDIRAEPLSESELQEALTRFGGGLVNTRSRTWAQLDTETRGMEPAALLAAHPAAMKRPLIRLRDGRMFLGKGADRAALAALMSG